MINRIRNKLLGVLAIAAAALAAAPAPAQGLTPPATPQAGAAATATGQSATGTPATGAPASSPVITDTGYILGAGDVVEVQVVGRGDYQARVRIQSDGTVQLPLIGTVKADNQTSLQLASLVSTELRKGGFYAKPVVAVDIASYSSRYITVLGEVAQPGLVPIDRAYRASEILARVGGVRESGADHLLVRRATGEEQRLVLATLATGGPAEDPVINPGDKLFVPAAKTFYIYGQIAAPGVYRLEPDTSLRKAIARGGGLTASGSDKRVKVFREGKEIKKYEMNAAILPGDVVVIGERFF